MTQPRAPKPDGYTILLASTVTTAGNAAVFKQMPLDVTKDIVSIVGFAETPFVLCVAPDSPINSIAELTAFIKSKDGKATYGSATTSALASTEIYLQKVGATATHVAYKATANAIQDVTAKQIDFAFADVVFAVGQAKQGRIKILATASDMRSPALPDVPTLKELNWRSDRRHRRAVGRLGAGRNAEGHSRQAREMDQRNHAVGRNAESS